MIGNDNALPQTNIKRGNNQMKLIHSAIQKLKKRQ